MPDATSLIESVATRATHPVARWPRLAPRVDSSAAAIWVLSVGLVLYLGFDGGGYDVIVSSQVGVILWWGALMAVVWGLVPAVRPSRWGLAALGLFAAFAAWTALGITWSLSSERSLQDLSRVVSYLAVLVLAIGVHRDRAHALRHTIDAVAAGIAVIACFALISRLFPDSFPASHVTAAFLSGAQGRLSWPLNYWNGLGALVAFGIPLMLSVATSARTIAGRVAAGAALPMLILCGYLTLSRAAAGAGAVALVVFLALAPERFQKLATVLVAAAGGAVLIVAAHHRGALDNGFTGHLASTQGRQVFLTLILTCAGVGLAQVGIALAVRHGTLPRPLQVSPRRARIILVVCVVVGIAVGLAANGPHHLSHAWTSFKSNGGVAHGAARLGSFSGEGRYTYWKTGIDASAGRRWQGTGPGTFQLVWDAHAPIYSPIVNAHSLYVETLVEVGIVGLTLLVAFLVLLLVCGVRAVVRCEGDARVRAAAATAALLAFMTSASVDWVWQLPVLPSAFLLIAAALVAPAPRPVVLREQLDGSDSQPDAASRSRSRVNLVLVGRIVAAAVAIACLVGIAIPLATARDVRQSQAEAAAGNLTAALADARSAARLEPGASTPDLQIALVLELEHRIPLAITAAEAATRNESENWANWLVLSRLEAEAGNAPASIADYERARTLNRQSPIFSSL